MVDFDFIRVHLLSPPACVCASACSRYAARRITSRMPPAAWSGQWVSNAGGHQSRDLNPVFIAGKRLFADRDKWGQNRPPARLIDRGDRPLSRNPATSRSFTVSSGNLRSTANAWWRTQSRSNRSHRSNSLLTAKITGNFEHSGPEQQISGKSL